MGVGTRGRWTRRALHAGKRAEYEQSNSGVAARRRRLGRRMTGWVTINPTAEQPLRAAFDDDAADTVDGFGGFDELGDGDRVGEFEVERGNDALLFVV
jgi:hypothetical protein